MITLAKVQAAVKAAPHYRVRVGHLEVIGTPGASRWTFDYVVRNAPRASDGRLFTAYGRANAAEYLEARGAYLAIEEVTLAPKCDAVAPTIASYRTHIEGRKALGYSRHGVMLFSFVPHLMGHKEPTFEDALAILNGEQIIVAMAVHNRALAPNAGATADGMLSSVRTSFLSAVMRNTRRTTMIDRNRAIAARLRARRDARPAVKLAAYMALRARGSTARDAFALAWFAPNSTLRDWGVDHSTVARDAARTMAVRNAAYRLAFYLREARDEIANPRKAFRSMYGIERITPEYRAANRTGV